MNEFKMNNGAEVLKRDEATGIVLAKFRDSEYVTWMTDDDGIAYWGHYFGDDIVAASADYAERIK
jgi:hypothetical protein